MRLLIFKQRARYQKFEDTPLLDSIVEAGFKVIVEKENDNTGYFGSDYLMHYVEFDNETDAVAFKLKYL
jgi:hypothetical protein